jgi:adenylate cyclase
VVRRVPLIQTVDGTVYPSLSAEALRVAQGAGTHIVKTSTGSGERTFGETVGVTAMKIGRIVVPTTARGEVMLYDTGRVPARYISAATVLGESAANAKIQAKLQGHIVLIGTSAPGLKDVRATPLSSAAPGVSAHAQALEQMINGTHLRRPDWAGGLETLALVAVGGALIAILPFAGALWCAVLGGVAVVSGGVASWLAFDQLNWLFDPVFPALAGLVVYVPMTTMRFVQTEREKRFVRSAFQHYLSPSLVERLARQPESLRLGGENRELTLLFSDVRGFTSVAETMTPEELTQFINELLTPMTEAVLTRQGCVDKYMGDAIMAFWNAPTEVPDHQMAAAYAALDMRTRLIDLNTSWQAKFADEGRDFPIIAIGVGLNTGICCVGNLGSEQRFDYSALGDDVNLTSRLEGQSKTYGVDIVVSETTRDACGDRLAFLELDLIRVKGRQTPVRIFGLVGDGALWADRGFATFAERHAEMIWAYRRKAWDTAEAACVACRATLAQTPAWVPAGCLLDGIYQVYQARIATLRADPPEADWDAVFTAETK